MVQRAFILCVLVFVFVNSSVSRYYWLVLVLYGVAICLLICCYLIEFNSVFALELCSVWFYYNTRYKFDQLNNVNFLSFHVLYNFEH